MAAREGLDLLSVQDSAEELASGKSLAVDVRQTEEWQHGHIDGAVQGEWERRSWSKLPTGGGLEAEGTRLG